MLTVIGGTHGHQPGGIDDYLSAITIFMQLGVEEHYAKMHPNVDVQLTPQPPGGEAAMREKMTALLAGGGSVAVEWAPPIRVPRDRSTAPGRAAR